MICTADFETNTKLNNCSVWAWAVCNIDNTEDIKIGLSLDGFMDFIRDRDLTLYFHNLKFDGEFIIIWLLEHGFDFVRKNPKERQFSALIDGQNKWYSITINFGNNRVKIFDSLKIIPFKIKTIAQTFGLDTLKGEIDYKKPRMPGHILTRKETEYIKNDVIIPAKALKVLFDQGLNRMTQGSNALSDFKKIMGKKNFNRFFPITKFDRDIRQAYKGGFTYASPKFKSKIQGSGIVLDINSLYPYVMYTKLLPYGEPIFFKGKYKPNKHYPLYIQMLKCQFELKENHLPTIQIKNSLGFIPTEYLTSSKRTDKNGNEIDEEVTLCLTNVDLELFMEHYIIYNEEYISGYMFMGYIGFFKSYIDKWFYIKINAEAQGNKGMRQLAKLMLNALYGKFGTSPVVLGKTPYLKDGVLHMRGDIKDERDPVYIPMACFITAYAREKTIKAAQLVYHRFMYADTDSLHLKGLEFPEELEIDDIKLGAWKHEATFRKAKYIRTKCYIEDIWNKKEKIWETKVTCAGLPDSCHNLVTFDNFNIGKTYWGKLHPVHTEGGVVLVEGPFTIRP